MKNWYLRIGMGLIGLIFLMLLISVFYTPYDANANDPEVTYEAPSIQHPFGTDKFGRDILSRVMVGSQTTFFIAFGTVLTGIVFGTLIGACSGYFGGVLDEILMRVNDALLAFPGILIALILVTVFEKGNLALIVIALGIIFIPSYIRVVRGEFVRYRNMDFVNSARTMGAGSARIMFRHILPNIYPQLIPSITIGFSNAILAEASLSFLGLGVQPPNASWGSMIHDSYGDLFYSPWMSVIPGIMIVIGVIGFNFLAEGLKRNAEKERS